MFEREHMGIFQKTVLFMVGNLLLLSPLYPVDSFHDELSQPSSEADQINGDLIEFNDKSSLYKDIKSMLSEIETLENSLKNFDSSKVEEDGSGGYRFKKGVTNGDDEALRIYDHMKSLIKDAQPKIKKQLDKMKEFEDQIAKEDRPLFHDVQKKLQSYSDTPQSHSSAKKSEGKSIIQAQKAIAGGLLSGLNLTSEAILSGAKLVGAGVMSLSDYLTEGMVKGIKIQIIEDLKNLSEQIKKTKPGEKLEELKKQYDLRLKTLMEHKENLPKPGGPEEKIWQARFGSLDELNYLRKIISEYEDEHKGITQTEDEVKSIQDQANSLEEKNQKGQASATEIKDLKKQNQQLIDKILNDVESSNKIGPSLGITYNKALAALQAIQSRLNEASPDFVGPRQAGGGQSSLSQETPSSTQEKPSTQPSKDSSSGQQSSSTPKSSIAQSGITTESPSSKNGTQNSQSADLRKSLNYMDEKDSNSSQLKDRFSDAGAGSSNGDLSHQGNNDNSGMSSGKGRAAELAKSDSFEQGKQKSDRDKTPAGEDGRYKKRDNEGSDSEGRQKGSNSVAEGIFRDQNNFKGSGLYDSNSRDSSNRGLSSKWDSSTSSSQSKLSAKESDSLSNSDSEKNILSDKDSIVEGGNSDELGTSPRKDQGKKKKDKTGTSESYKTATRDPIEYGSNSNFYNFNTTNYQMGSGFGNGSPTNSSPQKYVLNSDGTFSPASNGSGQTNSSFGRRFASLAGNGTDEGSRVQGSFEDLEKAVKEDTSSGELIKLSGELEQKSEVSVLDKLGLGFPLDSISKFIEELSSSSSSQKSGDITDLINSDSKKVTSEEMRKLASQRKLLTLAETKSLGQKNPTLWSKLLAWLGI